MSEYMSIKSGSPEMETLLQAGYPFSIDEAKRLVEDRKTNPGAVPYEKATAASAMLEAFKAKPQVISKRPAWKRTKEA